MLPLGRKNARKCSECDITCHANCAHLVPDFCGMSMETANQLLRDWRDINRAKAGRPLPVKHQTHRSSASTSQMDPQMAGLAQGMGGMQLGGAASPPGPQGDGMYGRSSMQGMAPTSPPASTDPRYAPYPQQAPPYTPGPPGAGMPPRLPPGARNGPSPQAYAMDPSLQQRPPMGYDQMPPPDHDGRGSLNFDVRERCAPGTFQDTNCRHSRLQRNLPPYRPNRIHQP
jgi:hypothetical protein